MHQWQRVFWREEDRILAICPWALLHGVAFLLSPVFAECEAVVFHVCCATSVRNKKYCLRHTLMKGFVYRNVSHMQNTRLRYNFHTVWIHFASPRILCDGNAIFSISTRSLNTCVHKGKCGHLRIRLHRDTNESEWWQFTNGRFWFLRRRSPQDLFLLCWNWSSSFPRAMCTAPFLW